MDPTPFTLPAITDADAEPARWLKVELVTRITTQPLHYRSGDEETAAKSVSTLFSLTRKLLTKHPRAQAFEMAALFLLNCIARPNTARWHRWMVDGKFQDESSRRCFRYELKRSRPQLAAFADLLGLLCHEVKKNDEARDLFKRLIEATLPPAKRRTSAVGCRRASGRKSTSSRPGCIPI